MGIGQRQVFWNQKENVGELDLNNMQSFLRAVTGDWMFGAAGAFNGLGTARQSVAGSYDHDVALYCRGDSGAPWPSGITALQVNNLLGPILQWKTGGFPRADISDPLPANWGTDPYAMIYWLSDNELQTVHAVGDATNPRWDLVCVKLDDVENDVADQETRLQKQLVSGVFVISSGVFIKRRKIKLTKQVVQGTPAGSPTIPAVPAGFVPYYAVKIPATWNTTLAVDNDFHDYRMPLGGFSVDVPAWQAIENGSGLAATGNAGTYRPMTLGASSTFDFLPRLPVSHSSCRLVGVGHLVGEKTGTVPTITIGRFNAVSGGTYNQMGGNATWRRTNLEATSFPSGTDLEWDDDQISTSSFHSGGNNPPSAAAKPPWGTGWPSGYASRERSTGTFNLFNGIGMRYATPAASTLKIAMVRFYFAGTPS